MVVTINYKNEDKDKLKLLYVKGTEIANGFLYIYRENKDATFIAIDINEIASYSQKQGD